MKAQKPAVEAIAEAPAAGVDRAKHARELSVTEMEEVGGGLAPKNAIVVFDYEGNPVQTKAAVIT